MADRPAALRSARFLGRPHRFAVEARLRSGEIVVAHLADPGRLSELLRPQAMLRLRPAPERSRRTTRWTAALVRTDAGAWVSLETGRANRIAERLLTDRRIRGLGRFDRLRREVTLGDSRFDFLLEGASGSTWVEVKSVTLVEAGIARFPDAPTARGRRHVEGLTRLATAGERAAVLFLVQRPDARAVTAHRRIDPGFADALGRARTAGVLLRAAAIRFEADGSWRHQGALPVRTCRG